MFSGKRSLRNVHGLFAFLLAAALILAPVAAHAFEILIDVAPNTLNLQSQGEVVTVHTDISYGDVDAHSVLLNGVAIDSWKADNQGNFVAKFLIEEIKDLPLVIGEPNLLQLVGTTSDEPPVGFYGEAEIMVVNNIPNKSR